MIFQRQDLHTLTGSYALGALDGPEEERFERHLRRCSACTTEVRGLGETAARLALAGAVQPPAGLRDRALAAARQTRQLPPVTSERSRRRRRRASTPWPAWMPRLSVTITAISTAGAVILGVTQAATTSQLGHVQAHARAVAAVLGAPDARIAIGTTSAGGTVTAVVSQQQRELVLTTDGLRSLPAGQVYELWLMGPAGTQPAGLLPAAQSGRTEPVLTSGLKPGDRMSVTVEPAGGSNRPTSALLAVMPLPA